MFDHLLVADPKDFIPLDELPPMAELDAKYQSATLSDNRIIEEAQSDAARAAFAMIVDGSTPQQQKQALAAVTVPAAVRELVGMLTAYDWAFVEQAKELRGYTVAQILEETKHPDARIRLKALELLGKVTEVALFTERVEVKQTGMSDAELDEELKQRLQKYADAQKTVIEGETHAT